MELGYVFRPIVHCCSQPKTLPDDIIMEILVRLPDKFLAQFKSVCKGWYSLISQICLHRTPTLAGLFVSACTPRKFSSGKVYFYASLREDKGAKLLEWDENRSSYGLPFRSHPGDLLGSCNGLLLFVKASWYYISNPSTRQCVSIPRPSLTQEVCCLDASLAFDPLRSTCYKVAQFERTQESYLRYNIIMDIYSSENRKWSRHKLDVDDPVLGIQADMLLSHDTYFDGALFRLSWNSQLVRFDLEEVSARVVNLPVKFISTVGCIGVQMGQLFYANNVYNIISIWLFVDDGKWDLMHKIYLDYAKWLEPIAFHPCSNLIYLRGHIVIHVYDLENKRLEELFRLTNEKYECLSLGIFSPLTCARFLAPFTKGGDILLPK